MATIFPVLLMCGVSWTTRFYFLLFSCTQKTDREEATWKTDEQMRKVSFSIPWDFWSGSWNWPESCPDIWRHNYSKKLSVWICEKRTHAWWAAFSNVLLATGDEFNQRLHFCLNKIFVLLRLNCWWSNHHFPPKSYISWFMFCPFIPLVIVWSLYILVQLACKLNFKTSQNQCKSLLDSEWNLLSTTPFPKVGDVYVPKT